MATNKMEEEIWKPVEIFSGCYEVSNFGNIRSIDRTVTYSHHCDTNTCIKGKNRKLFIDHRGYYSVTLRKEGKSKTKRIHRLVAIAFIPNPENLPQVNHKDAVKTNNHVSNLEWCTNAVNREHAVKLDLIPKGEDCVKATITNEDAKQVKILLSKNTRNIDIHRKLGINLSIIEQIKANISWKHIKI